MNYMSSDFQDSLDCEQQILATEFNAIFCNQNVHRALCGRGKSFELWYYCMCNFIIMHNILLTKQDPTLSSQNTSNLIKKMLKILASSLNLTLKSITTEKMVTEADVLFISRDRFIEIKNGGKTMWSDSFFYGIIEELSKSSSPTKMAVMCTSAPLGVPTLQTYNIFEFIYLGDVFKSVINTITTIVQWKYNQNKILTDLNHKNALDIPFSKRINSFFSFKTILYSNLIDYSYYNIINRVKPKVIVSNDDVMPLKPKSEKCNFKFITMQYALHSYQTELYRRLFTEEFGSESVKSDHYICIGDYFKPLREFSGVSKTVVVMGQTRYDILARADKIYNRKEILTNLNLDPNKKMILWITQTHGLSLEENIDSINAVYSVMLSLNDVQLVIKLHPDEDQSAPLYRQNKCFKPIIATRDTDIYALLFACDLVIVKFSMAVFEAILLKKPVVVLNLSGEPDLIDYAKEGVAYAVRDGSDLKHAVEMLIRDSSPNTNHRNNFIKKYLYSDDGKATERVVMLIKSYIIA